MAQRAELAELLVTRRNLFNSSSEIMRLNSSMDVDDYLASKRFQRDRDVKLKAATERIEFLTNELIDKSFT
jgi:hypothetical protein